MYTALPAGLLQGVPLHMPPPAITALCPQAVSPGSRDVISQPGGHSQEMPLHILPKECTRPQCTCTRSGTPFHTIAPTLDHAASVAVWVVTTPSL